MRSLGWIWLGVAIAACSVELAPLEPRVDGGEVGGGHGPDASSGGSCVYPTCTTGGNGGPGGGASSGGGAGGAIGGSGGLAGSLVIGGAGSGGIPSGGGAGGVIGGSGGTTVGCDNLSVIIINSYGDHCFNTNQQYCECLGCGDYCYDIPTGFPLSDCTCPSCWNDDYCYGSGAFCDNNGLCNPLDEGCQCADCAWLCP